MKSGYLLMLIVFVWSRDFAQGQSTVCSVEDATTTLMQPMWVQGPVAPLHDDAVSEAQCPEGYYVRKCLSNTRYQTDGSFIKDIRTCQAVNSALKINGLRALALCQATLMVDVQAFAKDSQTAGEYIQCPEGYTMDSCVLFNPWSQNALTEVIYGDNRCTWRTINGGTIRYARMTYTCVKA